MSSGLRLRRQAKLEIAEIRRWYNRQRYGLGNEVMEELESMFETIMASPHRHAVSFGVSRCATLKRFPYKIFYLLRRGHVVVFHVLHVKRDPTSRFGDDER